MEFIQTVLAFLIAIIILVVVHEFGHFYVARLCGVKVLRFSIGLGSPIWSRYDKHGTEYAIAPFPVGGYVKMLGEHDDDILPGDEHKTLESKPLWQRIAILAAGPAANFILATLIFFGMFIYGTYELAPIVGKVEPKSEAAYAGLEQGQEIIAIDGVKTPSQEKVLERMMMRLGETGNMSMTVKYPGDSELDYKIQLTLDAWLKGVTEPDPLRGMGISFYRREPTMSLAKIYPGTPAENAGLQVGDKLVSADDTVMRNWDAWVDYVRSKPEVPLLLSVERNGSLVVVELTPEPFEQADGTIIGRAGVSPKVEPWPKNMLRRVQLGPIEALFRSFEKCWTTSVSILVSVKKLIVREISTKNLSGPIGIATVAGDFFRAGLDTYIRLLAILSVYLGVFNLLPIPILDGGRILYYVIEGVKGGPLSEKFKLAGLQLGLVMLLVIMVMATYNDILRLLF